MTKLKAALFYDYPPSDGVVFDDAVRARLAGMTTLYPAVVHATNFDQHAPHLADLEVIFATWGMMHFSPEQFARLPKLKAVFYAAGNVKAFARPLVDNGIILVSAWAINAIPTSEMCFAQILLSLRGYFRAVRNYREQRNFSAKAFPRSGAAHEVIGMIGAGHIAQRVIGRLRELPLTLIASDPMLTPARAAQLGVELVPLDELFRRALIVSNHTPDLEWTRGTLGAPLFESMREGATFINTGRGAQVVEADLARVLQARPDLTALLDVTAPEPPPQESTLWQLPNVVMSPHIGGTIGNEVGRLAECAIEEFEAWQAGRALRYQVTQEVLRTMG